MIDEEKIENRQLPGTLSAADWRILRGMLMQADGVNPSTRAEWVVDPGSNCIAKQINGRGTTTDFDLIQRVAVAA